MAYIECPKCGGDGEIKCPKCGGSSFAHSIKAATNEMFGINEDEQCTRCHDKFVVQCNECGGTGSIRQKVEKTKRTDSGSYDYQDYSSDSYSLSSDSEDSNNNSRAGWPVILCLAICNIIGVIIAYNNFEEKAARSNGKTFFETLSFILSLPIFLLLASGIGAILGYLIQFLLKRK